MARRPEIRPTFTILTPHSPAEIRHRVHLLLNGTPRLRGIAFEHRLEMSIGEEDAHFYSPQLIVLVQETSTGSRLEARFGPDPYVWAFYLLGAGGLTLLTLFAGFFGIGQWLIGQSPTALWVAPAAGILAALVYGASYVGQGLGSDQMFFLRHSLLETVGGREAD